MYSNFSFRLVNEGEPTQYLEFRPTGSDIVNIPLPGVTFPTENEARFRQMFQVLRNEKLVEDKDPIFEG